MMAACIHPLPAGWAVIGQVVERAQASLHLVEDIDAATKQYFAMGSVSSTPCELRSNIRTPSVPSISDIAFETAGCEILSLAAAFAMLPASATAIRI